MSAIEQPAARSGRITFCVGRGQDVGRLGHEVHAAEHDELGVRAGRRLAGELERVAGDVGELDDLVALVVVAEHEHPLTRARPWRPGPGRPGRGRRATGRSPGHSTPRSEAGSAPRPSRSSGRSTVVMRHGPAGRDPWSCGHPLGHSSAQGRPRCPPGSSAGPARSRSDVDRWRNSLACLLTPPPTMIRSGRAALQVRQDLVEALGPLGAARGLVLPGRVGGAASACGRRSGVTELGVGPSTPS